MGNYANQSTIYLTDLEKIKHTEGNGNRFIQPIDFKYEAAAMRRLNGNAFKLWRFLLRWYGDPKKYDFSPAAINKELGMGKNGPNTAFDELVRYGYLTPIPEKMHHYIFTPVLDVDYLDLQKHKDF